MESKRYNDFVSSLNQKQLKFFSDYIETLRDHHSEEVESLREEINKYKKNEIHKRRKNSDQSGAEKDTRVEEESS